MVPTKERAHTSILFTHNKENILIDCGEGTQRQLRIANIAAPKITRILITHWHGDHVFGLPGLLQTILANAPEHAVQLYGPRGMQRFCEQMFEVFFVRKPNVQIHEVDEGVVFSTEELEVTTLPLRHSVPCVGYRIQEKDKRIILLPKVKKKSLPEGPILRKLQQGKSVTHQGNTVHPNEVTKIKKGKVVSFVFDTALCSSCTALAEDADCLVIESTYADNLREKAEEYLHMTATQAATVANQASAKQLILTHFSQRYKTTDNLLQEAQAIFPATQVAHDFMKVKL